MMEIETLIVGMLEVNCYLIRDEQSGDGLIVDPGDEAERIAEGIREFDMTPRGILLTHGHVDHIRAVSSLSRHYDIPVLLHADDHELYSSPENKLSPWLPAAKNLPLPGEVSRELPGLGFEMLHTPGHTPGGVSYYFAAENLVFTGDTLFRRGVGRTDFAGGNYARLMGSIHRVLLTLPPETLVFPGHGPRTTIADEAADNPFL